MVKTWDLKQDVARTFAFWNYNRTSRIDVIATPLDSIMKLPTGLVLDVVNTSCLDVMVTFPTSRLKRDVARTIFMGLRRNVIPMSTLF